MNKKVYAHIKKKLFNKPLEKSNRLSLLLFLLFLIPTAGFGQDCDFANSTINFHNNTCTYIDVYCYEYSSGPSGYGTVYMGRVTYGDEITVDPSAQIAEVYALDPSGNKIASYWTSECGEYENIYVTHPKVEPQVSVNNQDYYFTNAFTVCEGEHVRLAAHPAIDNYTWSWTGPNGFHSNHRYFTLSNSITPDMAGRYTVTYTSGCMTSTSNIDISVVTGANITSQPSNQFFCGNNSPTFCVEATGTGLSYQWEYSWNGVNAEGNAGETGNTTKCLYNFHQAAIGAYFRARITDANGCVVYSDWAQLISGETNFANAGENQTICVGESIDLTASGGASYQWSNSLGDGATQMVSPTETTTYTVTVTSSNGCTDTDDVMVTVNDNPTANAGVDQTICIGETTTLTATGGVSYQWSNGLGSGATQTVSPTQSTTYTVTVTNSGGCTDTDEVTITVNNNPTANAGVDQTICIGETTTLTATGGVSYQWSNGLGSGATQTVSPTQSTTYTVTVTNSGGCTDTDEVTITVNNNPTANIDLDENALCNGAGETTTLTATGGASYQWSNNSTNASINVGAGTYTVTVTNNDGCTDTAMVTISDTSQPAGTSCDDGNPNTIDDVIQADGCTCEGIIPTESSIGNFVFEDLDKDGIQDANEPGIDGVEVKLLDGDGNVLATTTTANGGLYLFDNLAAGMYKVMVNAPEEYTITTQDAGTDDVTDSDINDAGMTDMIVLGISEDIRDVDAGLFLTDPKDGSIGDFVFEDLDKDGIQDANEPGIDGVEVKLLDGDGNVLATTTTANGGLYLFDNLAAGMYKVMVNAPEEYTITTQDAGTDDVTDSDINDAGMTDMIVLGISEDIRDVDAGLFLTDPKDGSIGNRVFEDLNQNGLQDVGEPGVAGVPVKLLDENGLVIATTTTGSTGYYNFFNLGAGMYQVMFTIPTDYTISPQDIGTNDYADSDIDANGMTAPVTLGISQAIHTEDAGIYLADPANGSIGDTVFEDLDKDGIQDANEPGIDGVTVKLLDENGATLATTTTSNGGQYLFDNLPAGTYQVMINTPVDYTVSPQDAGTDESTDSDINDAGMTAPIVLGVSEDIDDVDAGLYLTDPKDASIEGTVFTDDNKDGIQDPIEAGVANIPVKLLDENGTTVQTTFTNSNGDYAFNGLAGGDYTVMITTPGNQEVSPQNQGTDETVDSDINDAGMTDPITLQPSDDVNDVDAGISPIDPKDGSIGNRVFEDLNQNGLQDVGEPGVAGVPVKLLDENGLVIATTTTGSTGYYNFFNLGAGMYQVMFTIPTDYTISPQDIGTNDYADSDIDANGMTAPVTLGISQAIHTEDAGIYLADPANGSIGDTVFEDLDKDGIQDANEPGIDGVTVKLLDENGATLATTTTSNGGQYLFDNLPAGTYQVMINTPVDYTVSPQDAGTDESTDSDINDAGMTAPIVLGVSEDIDDVDAGLYSNEPTDPKDASLGNKVFEDLNQDGIQNNNEPGIAGVTVNLLDANGTVLDTDVTSNGGWYNFPNLAAGTYQVVVEIPTGYAASPQTQGNDFYVDSNIDTNGSTGLIVLGESENNITIDAGIYDDSTEPMEPQKIWLEAECGDLGADWTVGTDTNASNDDYIVRESGDSYTPPTFATSPAIATYTFDVTQMGAYKIWARILTPNSLDDSFWVQVDNGAWIKWNGIPYSNQWQWDDVHNADNGYQMVLFDLTEGMHTLRIAYREDGAQLDKILIATTNVIPSGEGEAAGNCDETPPSSEVCLEAECGTLGADWEVTGDVTASNGTYIESPLTNYNRPSSTDQIASYNFDLSQNGFYYIWGRVQTAGSSGDSFWVRVDGGDWINWNGIQSTSGWTWVRVQDAANGYQVVGFDLAEGNHTLEIAYRETGTILDKICITERDKLADREPAAQNCNDVVNNDTSLNQDANTTATLTDSRATQQTITAQDIQAYPNPTSGLLNLNIYNLMDKNVLLTVNTVTGQEVLRQQLNTENPTTQLDLSSYQDGVYTVFFHIANEGIISKKIVILKQIQSILLYSLTSIF